MGVEIGRRPSGDWPITTALGGRSGPRSVHQDPAHEPGRQGEEMRAILPIDPLRTGQAEVRRVNQRGALQRRAGTLVAQVAPSLGTQLAVDQRHQPVECLLVSSAPRLGAAR